MNLIGPAGQILHELDLSGLSRIKLMLYGPPGVGKTALAEAIAENVSDSRWDIESENGRNITIDKVREWQESMRSSSMFGKWKVRIINEADTMTRPAQDLMLSLLDELPENRAIICTSNLDTKEMTQRFITRFMQVKVDSPSDHEIKQLLIDRGLPETQAGFIATTCAGNVRAAIESTMLKIRRRKPANLELLLGSL